MYFSRAGENYVNGVIKDLEIGNTEIAAGIIQKFTGAEVFKLEPIQEYSPNYNTCIGEAQDDQKRNARPKLKSYPKNMEDIHIIYLGYPNYWGTMPMCVFTFLEDMDFTGKIIKPFCTHEGSGLGRSVGDIKSICPGAEVKEGFAIHGANVDKVLSDLENWCSRV